MYIVTINRIVIETIMVISDQLEEQRQQLRPQLSQDLAYIVRRLIWDSIVVHVVTIAVVCM